MEVEARVMANIDLQSNSPFSYSLDGAAISSSELYSRDFPTPASLESDAAKTNGSGSLAAQFPGTDSMVIVDSKCDSSETAWEPNRKVQPMVIDGGDALGLTGKLSAPDGGGNESSAAVRVQKVYRSYRTRRRLADSAVVAEELWWQALDYARLNHSTISFFNFLKPETAASRWSRISLNASKVGKGLSKDAKAQKLAFQHWIEAIDPRHRYGHTLHLYYEEWCKADAGQPFFYWLDVGEGKKLDLKECRRAKLRQQCIKYLGPQEREHYEYLVIEGKIIHKQTGDLLDTNRGAAKWIFVMSTFKKLYAGEKKKGLFHHSSFLAGGATSAAGRIEAEHGILKRISAYSGHYRPTDDSLDSFLSFLKDNGVKLDAVEIHKASEDLDNYNDGLPNGGGNTLTLLTNPEPPVSEVPEEDAKGPSSESAQVSEIETKTHYKRTLSGGLQSPKADVPKSAMLQRINSKKAAKSYQLGHQLSLKWSSGAGPRIGCVADYPVELRMQALEFVNLSPRTPRTPSSYRVVGGRASPTATPTSDECTNDGTSGV